MSLKQFILKRIKDNLLPCQCLASMAIATETSLSLPVPDPRILAFNIDCLVIVAFLVLRQKK